MARKSELKVEERMEVVLALLRREESAAELSRRHQVSEATIYRWRDAFLAAGKAGLGKPEGSAEAAATRRIEQLEGERRLRILRISSGRTARWALRSPVRATAPIALRPRTRAARWALPTSRSVATCTAAFPL
jgi:transposase-like protein